MKETGFFLGLCVLELGFIIGVLLEDLRQRINYAFWAKMTYRLTKKGAKLIEYKKQND